MKGRLVAQLGLLLPLVACATAPEEAPRQAAVADAAAWNLRGTWTDACCCKVPCPCLFGTGPTEGFCEGASVIEIEKGRHGDVDLDGLAAVLTYRVGGWTNIVVSDEASAEQVAAFGAVVPELLTFIKRGADPVLTSAPISVERGDGTIRFEAPDTRVELVLLETKTGEPIVLSNLPAKGTPFPTSHEHVQYESVLLKHESERGTFEHTGRNGFSSRLELSGS